MNSVTTQLTVGRSETAALQSSFDERERLVACLDEYQKLAIQTDQNRRSGFDGLAFPLLGLFGEVGTLLSALKKKQREGNSYVGYSVAILEEFGDVLWYLSNVAWRASLSFGDLAKRSSFNWREDNAVDRDRASPDSPEFETAVIALAGRTGLLLNEFSAGHVTNSRDLLGHLAEIFQALVEAAILARVDLRRAARENISKIDSRWPMKRKYAPLFDQNFDESERLPRLIEMHIMETQIAGKTFVIQLCNGIELGSQLTDNKIVEDDYRFHDVFHLAYAAVLGWSPCLRALLKRKRKSRPEIDETQDGARAILIEEGVSTLVFHHALQLNYFAEVTSLDYSLLKAIRDFVTGYEVDQCPLWQWEKAILDGFEVFRKFRAHRRGIVTADLLERSVSFKPVSE